MEDMEAERRMSRRKRKLSTRQGVVIGVATVAGLGLVAKLFSFLRREKPKKVEDGDIQALEAVLSGDAAKSALPPQTTEVHVFANLENDEPSHEAVNGHQASPPGTIDAGSEVTKKDDDVTENGEVHGDRDTTTPTLEDSELSPVSQAEVHVKETPHAKGELEGTNHQVEVPNEDEVKVNGEVAVTEVHVEDKEKPHVEQLPSTNLVELPSGDESKTHIEDAVEAKQPNGDALEVPVEDGVELPTKDESHHNEDVAELHNENESKPPSEEAEKPHSEDAAEQVELPSKDEEKKQTEDEKLQTEDEHLKTEDEHLKTEDENLKTEDEKHQTEDEGIQASE